MPVGRHSSQIDTLDLKLQIERKLGHENAEKYFNLFNRYLSLKISKSEFDKLCIGLIGRENIVLHNRLIRAIIKNVCIATTLPPIGGKTEGSLNVKVSNGHQRSSLQSLCRDVFPQSPRKGRTLNLRDRKLRDRPSPLGPYGKTHSVACEDSVPKTQEQQSATELHSLGSRPLAEVNSAEDGEEVEQAAVSPSIYSRSPLTAPLGIFINRKETRKALHNGSATASYMSTCKNSGELPDTSTLKTMLEQKLEMEGLNVSVDCVNLLNNGLDVYLERLIKPCLELAGSRSGNKHLNQARDQLISGLNGIRPMKYVQKPKRPVFVSKLDFRVAMESNPQILGDDWPLQLEKICLHTSEE